MKPLLIREGLAVGSDLGFVWISDLQAQTNPKNPTIAGLRVLSHRGVHAEFQVTEVIRSPPLLVAF